MYNIISIDLDILTSPCGSAYKDLISNYYNREYNFSNISNFIDIDKLPFNQQIYQKIWQIIQYYEQQVDVVYLGFDHSSILNAIEKEKNKFNNDYRFNIYNIDFHHDIVYGTNDEEQIVNSNICNCGNWIGYLNFNNYIKNYVWYKGIDSFFDREKLTDIKNPFCPKKLKVEDDLNNFPLDLNITILYITFSPSWVPINFDNKIIQLLNNIQKPIYYYPGPFFSNYQQVDFLNNKAKKFFYTNLNEGFIIGSDLQNYSK